MSKLKSIMSKVPRTALTFVTSPKFAACLGVGVALFQLAGALDNMFGASRGKKQIGFKVGDEPDGE